MHNRATFYVLSVLFFAVFVAGICTATIIASTVGAGKDRGGEGEMLKIEKQILKHEGFEPFPYKCTKGKLTIGIGRNLDDRGITMDEALILLRNDIAACEMDLYKIFGKEFFELDIARKHALIGMRFNLGATRFRGFTEMIQAIRNRNFVEAAQEMEKSLWWKDVGERARTLQSMMLSGGEG